MSDLETIKETINNMKFGSSKIRLSGGSSYLYNNSIQANYIFEPVENPPKALDANPNLDKYYALLIDTGLRTVGPSLKLKRQPTVSSEETLYAIGNTLSSTVVAFIANHGGYANAKA